MTDRAARRNVGSIDDLHESAIRTTGLDDFGDDDYLEPLGVLLDSYANEAGLTELGSKMFRYFLKGALVARLMSEASWQANPSYADIAITRPIFVTGLPRTVEIGSTEVRRALDAPVHAVVDLADRLACIGCSPPTLHIRDSRCG